MVLTCIGLRRVDGTCPAFGLKPLMDTTPISIVLPISGGFPDLLVITMCARQRKGSLRARVKNFLAHLGAPTEAPWQQNRDTAPNRGRHGFGVSTPTLARGRQAFGSTSASTSLLIGKPIVEGARGVGLGGCSMRGVPLKQDQANQQTLKPRSPNKQSNNQVPGPNVP